MTPTHSTLKLSHRLSVAPMMDVTDRHCRYFLRLMSRRCLLYTEMVVDHTILHAHREGRLNKYLSFSDFERPLSLQLGGSHPESLAEACKIAEQYGYDEINLNVGCPSDRVQSGRFGACLMLEPQRVADCLAAMQSATRLPVTVKHRIGVDDMDDYQGLYDFVQLVSKIGIDTFIVHARKAWLQGLSPAENRTVPPLRKDLVYQLKQDFEHLNIEINGEVRSLEQACLELKHVDGVMLGRIIRDRPWTLAKVDSLLFGDKDPYQDPLDILPPLQEYVNELITNHQRPHLLLRHISGLFSNRAGARSWRRFVSENSNRKPPVEDLLNQSARIFQHRLNTGE